MNRRAAIRVRFRGGPPSPLILVRPSGGALSNLGTAQQTPRKGGRAWKGPKENLGKALEGPGEDLGRGLECIEKSLGKVSAKPRKTLGRVSRKP